MMAVLLFPVQLLAVAVTIYLELVRSAQGGVYYGIKQLPPQVPQYQPLGQQVPHMPLGKEGIPMQHMGKEVPHMQYGKEYPHLPQYMKEVPQMPLLGKDMAPKKEKGRFGTSLATRAQSCLVPHSTLCPGVTEDGEEAAAGWAQHSGAPRAGQVGTWPQVDKMGSHELWGSSGHQSKATVILWAAAQPLSSPTCDEPLAPGAGPRFVWVLARG